MNYDTWYTVPPENVSELLEYTFSNAKIMNELHGKFPIRFVKIEYRNGEQVATAIETAKGDIVTAKDFGAAFIFSKREVSMWFETMDSPMHNDPAPTAALAPEQPGELVLSIDIQNITAQTAKMAIQKIKATFNVD